MAAKKRSGKGSETAWMAQGERYAQRLLGDEELRARLLGAYASARSAYGRLTNGKGPTHALFEDPKLQRELIDAATALRDASAALMGAPEATRTTPRRRRRRRGRALLLMTVGGVLALALSSGLRNKVLDMMFGAEETFDYNATSAAATPAPAPVAG
ncbi:MAG TPA: hypothetical protein VFW29_10250 [Solirubrobacteraceae bacterium]|nr:hypothetical protein [Solirubrobacteraceae bacterium]